MKRTTLDRRTFLKGLGAAATLGAMGSGGRVARARVPSQPVAVLVLDFIGAWNVHATFAARTHPDVNPSGIYRGRDTGILRVSNRLFDGRSDLVSLDSKAWGTRIPGFEDAAADYSLVGALQHDPTYTLDDHIEAARYVGTGYLDRLDAPGIGTVIARYAATKGAKAPPAVVIDGGWASNAMALAPPAWMPWAPLALTSAALPTAGLASVTGIALEDAVDAEARGIRPAAALAKIDRLRAYKEAFRTYRSFFLDPAIHFAAAPDARFTSGMLGAQSPTNAQLVQALGGSDWPGESAVALALRCIEGGSRFVAVGISFHDSHDHEARYQPVYVHDAHVLAGIGFLLKRMGLDKRVLVVALSEMARSPYAGGGVNEAEGTDHGKIGIASPKGYYGSNRQSVLLAHGPIVPQREAYPADPEWGDPIGAPCVTAELLAFLAECAGVERDDHPWNVSPDGRAIDADALYGALAR